MNTPRIKISIENMGEITVELYPDKAPLTVANFLSLVDRHFFDGLIFHRVISGFMIQGGGYTPDFSERETASICGEFASNGCRTNDIRHTRGTLSMARTSVPDSASSQFFIMHADAPHLDRQYAAFGKVIDGIDIVDRIAVVPTGRYGYFSDVPVTPVIIRSMERI